MINKKTVFLLGAGASYPYGYPVATELRKNVCKNFNSQYLEYWKRLEDKMRLKVPSLEKVNDFIDKFEKSSTKSIDLFLARNKGLSEIGKYVIAFEILAAERKSSFREKSFNVQQDWYSYLFNRMTDEIEKKERLQQFRRNKVSFVTFNYDRSLEYFLYESLRNSFIENSEEEIRNEIKRIKIVHIYDKVASLPWQNNKGGIHYKPEVSKETLDVFSRNLKTIYEMLDSNPVDTARELIKDAEQIFFLGFGYALENMVILKLPEIIPRCCTVIGTAFGCEEREIEDINSRILGGPVKVRKDRMHPERVEIENKDCLKLLRNYL